MENLVCRIPGDSITIPETEHPTNAWYAIRTRPRFEKSVAAGLRGKGYEEFLPVRRVHKAKSDRTIVVEHPLFPGYTFCRFDGTKRLPILTTPGVIYVVSSRERLSPVPDEEIASLQRVVQSALEIHDCPYCPGTKVRIVKGALIGVIATVIRTKDNYRVVVSVAMLQRSVAVEIPRDSLTALDLE